MQRAREERAAVADPRPGQAAPRGERRGGGCGSRPGFVVREHRDSTWEGEGVGRGRTAGAGTWGSLLLAVCGNGSSGAPAGTRVGTSLAAPSGFSRTVRVGIENQPLLRGAPSLSGARFSGEAVPTLATAFGCHLSAARTWKPPPAGFVRGPVSCQVTAYAGLREYGVFSL